MTRLVLLLLALLLAPPSLAADVAPEEPPPPAVTRTTPPYVFPPGLFNKIPVACDDRRVLGYIVSNFAWAEKRTWRRGFFIRYIENPRLRYKAFDGPSIIRHRHCQAEALMTNGQRYPIYYIVEDEMGLASIGDRTTYCVLGLDRWRIYDSACRTLR